MVFYTCVQPGNQYIEFTTTGTSVGGTRWNRQTPTDHVFHLGTEGSINQGGPTTHGIFVARCPWTTKIWNVQGCGWYCHWLIHKLWFPSSNSMGERYV